jgi:recombinational DNA repair ATPase RecF
MNLQIMLHNWRCFENQKFIIPNTSFVVSDENGKGKSSFLAALYSLYTSNPWVGTRFSDSLKQNSNYFGILTPYPDWSLAGEISRSGRLVTKYSSPKNFPFGNNGNRPVVFTYTPQDNNLFSFSRSLKLGYFDEIIGQLYPEYSKFVRELDKTVRSKNAYIKHCLKVETFGEEAMILSLGEKIFDLSQQVWQIRKTFLKELNGKLAQFESWIQSPLENWNIKHSISFIDGIVYPYQEIDITQFSHDNILQLWKKERIVGRSLFGAGRDDISVVSGHTQSNVSLSRGEMRLLVLFLKSAAQQILKEIKPETDVFWFLDDVFNEFDDIRESVVFDNILQHSNFSIITSTRNLSIDIPKFKLDQLTK